LNLFSRYALQREDNPHFKILRPYLSGIGAKRKPWFKGGRKQIQIINSTKRNGTGGLMSSTGTVLELTV
jgi:hypothetical protein